MATDAVPVPRSTLAGRIRLKAQRLADVLAFDGNTIARGERAAWSSAASLADLCALTERWLAGDLKSQPGYSGSLDVDEEDAPGLTDALIRLNHEGFLTRNSQAGFDGEGYDGAHWIQVAAAEGFASADTVQRLREKLAGTSYVVREFAPPRRSRAGGSIVPVTWRDGRPYTRFGGGAGPGDIEFELCGAGTPAVEDAKRAQQIVIYDPEPGRNTLWADLRARL
ncbi:MAG TPA: hypothetical protein VFM55_18935 [Micromonosporaceae bacterium]|nr:hypothetical protein [Micromonosporaceae bacterium]